MKIEVHKPLSILFLAAALAACGGGGGGSPAPAPEAPPPASPPAPAFAPTQFTVYRNTQPAAVAGAGAVTAGPTLSLGAGELSPAMEDKLIGLADHHTIIEKGRVVWHGTSAQLDADHGIWHRYLGI